MIRILTSHICGSLCLYTVAVAVLGLLVQSTSALAGSSPLELEWAVPGHGGTIDTVAVAPDGNSVVTSGADGSIKLWDTETGHYQGLLFSGFAGHVRRVVFSADGTLLAAVMHGGSDLGVLDVRTGAWLAIRCLNTDAQGNCLGTTAINDVCFSDDNTTLFVAIGREVRAVRTTTLDTLASVIPGDILDSVSRLAISPDGTRLAIGFRQSPPRVQLLRSDSLLFERELTRVGDIGEITTLSWSPDSTTIVGGQFNGVVNRPVAWSTDGSIRATIEPMVPQSIGPLVASRVSADGQSLATISASRMLMRASLAQPVPAFTPLAGPNLIADAAFSSDVTKLIAVYANGLITSYNTDDGSQRAVDYNRIHSEFSRHYPVAASSDGRHIAASVSMPGASDQVHVLDALTGAILHRLQSTGGPGPVSFAPDNSRLAVGACSGAVDIFEVTTGFLLRRDPTNNGCTQSIDWSTNGAFIVTGHISGVLRIADAATGAEIHSVQAHAGSVAGVAVSPDSSLVATAGRDDNHVRIWLASTGALLAQLPLEHPSSVRFSHDGAYLVAGQAVGKAAVFSTKNWDTHCVFTDLENWGIEVSLIPGTNRFLTKSECGSIMTVFDIDGCARVQSFGAGELQFARSIAVLPDGQSFAFSRCDGVVGLMRVDSLGDPTIDPCTGLGELATTFTAPPVVRYESVPDRRSDNTLNPGVGAIELLPFDGIQTYGTGVVEHTGPTWRRSQGFTYVQHVPDSDLLFLHPEGWPQFNIPPRAASIAIETTAPGHYALTGAVARGSDFMSQGNGVEFHVVIDENWDAPVYAVHIHPQHSAPPGLPFAGSSVVEFNVPLQLNAGQTVRLMVYPGPTGSDFAFDHTVLRYDIGLDANQNGVLDSCEKSLPDLQVASLSAPAQGLTGQSFEVLWTVANEGEAVASGPWLDRLYLSMDDHFDPSSDVLLATREFPAGNSLDLGASYSRSAMAHFPIEPGDFWLVVVTDAENVIDESEETNNIRFTKHSTSIVETPIADLIAEIIEVSTMPLSGLPMEVTYRVTNIGTGATVPTTWKDLIHVSLNDNLGWDGVDGDPRIFCGFNSPFFSAPRFSNPQTLGPGESYQQTVTITLPEDVGGEGWWVYVFATATDRYGLHESSGGQSNCGLVSSVIEANKLNNVARAPLSITINPSQPNLVVHGITLDPSSEVFSGDFVRISWMDANIGSGPTDTGSWVDEVFISTNSNPSISATDISLGTITRRGLTLHPEQSAALTLQPRVPVQLVGTHYIKVRTDITDVVTEFGAENDNVSVSAPLEVIQLPQPDLIATAVSGPSSGTGLVGHNIEVTWSVVNASGAPAPYSLQWTDAVYLSLTPELSEGAILLGSAGAVSVTTSDSQVIINPYSRTRTFRVPEETTPGEYFLIVTVDSDDDVFEGMSGGELNNARATSTPVSIELVPTDLIAEVNFDDNHQLPTSAAAGQSIPVSWRVTNSGAAVTPVASWTDRIYLSTNQTVGPGDHVLANVVHNGALQPGQAYNVDQAATLPLVPPGEYYLIARTDALQDVFEAGDSGANNFAVSPLTVTGDASDLVLTSVQAPDEAMSGQLVHISWTVENMGSLPTNVSSWSDTVYISIDDQFDSSDIVLGSQTPTFLGGLAPGGSYIRSGDFMLPINLEGQVYVIVRTDVSANSANGAVFESDETNNIYVRPMTVDVSLTDPANLIVESVVADSAAISGQSINISWTVDNTGEGITNAANWTDGVFLSRDQFLDPSSDIFLGQRQHSGLLGPGESYSVTDATFAIPYGHHGPYFVIVATDRNNTVFESSELDNANSTQSLTYVDLPEPSDLIVSSVTAPSDTMLGQVATFSWEVMNAGAAPVVGAWRDSVYLSPDPTWDIDDRRVEDLVVISADPPVSTPLQPGESRTFTATGRVPAVLPGPYHVIVRADIFNQIPETNETNNLGSSAATFELSAIPLVLGTPDNPMPYAGELGPGEELYFYFDAPDGETVRVSLEPQCLGAEFDLYVRLGHPPTTGDYDSASLAYESLASVAIESSTSGRYYVLARATSANHFCPITVTANVLPLGIDSVYPMSVGAGWATLELRGARLHEGLRGHFVHGDTGTVVQSLHLSLGSPAKAYIRANFASAILGDYTLYLIEDDHLIVAVAEEAVRVVEATQSIIEVDAASPSAWRTGIANAATVSIRNTGNTDVPIGLVAISLTAPVQHWELRSAQGDLVIEGNEDDDIPLASFIVTGLRPSEQRTYAMVATVASGELLELDVTIQHDAQPLVGDEPLFLTELVARMHDGMLFVIENNPSLIDSNPDLIELLSDQSLWEQYAREELIAAGVWYVVSNADGIRGPGDAPNPVGEIATGAVCAELATAAGLGVLPTAAACYCVVAAIDGRFCIQEIVEQTETTLQNSFQCGFTERCFVECRMWSPIGPRGPGYIRQTWAVPCPPDLEPFAPGVGLSCRGYRDVKRRFCIRLTRAIDPNEKAGPPGFGAEQWQPADGSIAYRIDFENLPEATAPASQVVIRDVLDPSLEVGTVRLGAIHFGATRVEVPENRLFYQTRVDVTGSLGVYVDITAGVNAVTNEVFWTLRSIDPLTGEAPTDAFTGFLPPEDETGRGQGFVEFTVHPRTDAATATVIRNTASIVFDFEEPIITNQVFNTLDAEAPTSMMASLPSEVPTTTIPLAWDGEDPQPGSGLAGFTVFASENGGPFTPVVGFSQGFGALFEGRGGATYEFYSVARDNAGNVEEAPTVPDAVTMVALQAPGALAVSDTTSTTFLMGALVSTNADFIEHAVFEETTGQWLGSDGQMHPSPTWLPLDQWQSARVRSLLPSTAYAFRAVARLGDGMQEVKGAAVQIVTTREGDVTGDNFVDCKDLDAVRDALGKVYPDSLFDARADVSRDSRVTFQDLGIVRRALQDDCSENGSGGPGPKKQHIADELVATAEFSGSITARSGPTAGARPPDGPSGVDAAPEFAPAQDDRVEHLEQLRELMAHGSQRLAVHIPDGDERAFDPMAELGVPAESLRPLALPDWWEIDLGKAEGGVALRDQLRSRLIESGVFVSTIIELEQGNAFVGPSVILGVEPGWLISENSLSEAIGEMAHLDELFRAGRSVARVLHAGASGDDVLRAAEALLAIPGVDSSEPGLIFSFNDGERALEAVHLDDLMVRLALWPRSASDVVTARAALETTLPLPGLRDAMSRSVPVDLTGDGVVDARDLSILINNWQQPGSIFEGDITGDGYVDEVDFRVLVEALSTGTPEPASGCGCTGTRR